MSSLSDGRVCTALSWRCFGSGRRSATCRVCQSSSSYVEGFADQLLSGLALRAEYVNGLRRISRRYVPGEANYVEDHESAYLEPCTKQPHLENTQIIGCLAPRLRLIIDLAC
jgi:hypothetical protein